MPPAFLLFQFPCLWPPIHRPALLLKSPMWSVLTGYKWCNYLAFCNLGLPKKVLMLLLMFFDRVSYLASKKPKKSQKYLLVSTLPLSVDKKSEVLSCVWFSILPHLSWQKVSVFLLATIPRAANCFEIPDIRLCYYAFSTYLADKSFSWQKVRSDLWLTFLSCLSLFVPKSLSPQKVWGALLLATGCQLLPPDSPWHRDLLCVQHMYWSIL